MRGHPGLAAGGAAHKHSPSSPSSSTWSAQLGFELRGQEIGERVPGPAPHEPPYTPELPPHGLSGDPTATEHLLKVASRHLEVLLHAALSPGKDRKPV